MYLLFLSKLSQNFFPQARISFFGLVNALYYDFYITFYYKKKRLVNYKRYLKHTNKHTSMVKHIHIQVSDETHDNLTSRKNDKTWKEVLEKGIKQVEE